MAVMDTKCRLLEAASILAKTEGCSGLAIDRIASLAGVSKGAFLYHFRSKRIMLEELIDHVLNDLSVLKHDPQGDSKTVRNAEFSEQGDALQSTLDLFSTLGCITAVDPTLKSNIRQKIRAILDNGIVSSVEVPAPISRSQCILLLLSIFASRKTPVFRDSETPKCSQ